MKQNQIWSKLTQIQKLKTLEAEIAKAKNELSCLQGDADKVSSRLSFCLSGIHSIKADREITE